MAYAPPPPPEFEPELNPYAAPKSELIIDDLGGRSEFAGYAGCWRRFAAYFIDYILTTLISMFGGFVIGFILGFAAAATGNQQVVETYGGIVGGVFGLIVAVVYYAAMESSATQATLGKMAMGIKVTDYDGRRISFGRALGRLLSKIVSGLILGIGFLMAAFTERKQALHDMMASTLVVKVR